MLCTSTFLCLQLIEDHVDDSVTTGGDHYSNVEAMDVEPDSETVVNDIEDSVNKKCESPYTSVRTLMLFPLSLSNGRSQMLEMSSKSSFKHEKFYS